MCTTAKKRRKLKKLHKICCQDFVTEKSDYDNLRESLGDHLDKGAPSIVRQKGVLCAVKECIIYSMSKI